MALAKKFNLRLVYIYFNKILCSLLLQENNIYEIWYGFYFWNTEKYDFDFAISDFRFPISDCLRFDVRVVVLRFPIYKLQDSMSNRWHFKIMLFELLIVRVHHFGFYVWCPFFHFRLQVIGFRCAATNSPWVSSWVIPCREHKTKTEANNLNTKD